MTEVWKDVKGYEGQYQVSSYGRVKSVPRVIIRSNGNPQTISEKILAPIVDKRSGYLKVSLMKGKLRTCRIHRLVAESFIPNPEGKPEVNHKDGNKQNNTVDNLEWVTESENISHAFANNLMTTKGESNPHSVVMETDVRSIRGRRIKGDKLGSVYADYKSTMSLSGFKKIWYNHTWKHVN